MEIKDQLDRALIFTQTPRRIVSLVPSQTELLVDLGLENAIVGITKFCVHPKYLRKTKTIVGGTKKVDYKKIKSLQPDIIICNKEENIQELVEACEKIAPVYVSDILTLEDNFKFIKDIGSIFNIEAKAQHLISKIAKRLTDFKSFIAKKPQQKVVYFIWKDPWMVAGDATFINELLKLNHYKNVFEDQNRYPEIDLAELSSLDLDLILLSSEPYPFKEKHIEEIQQYTSAETLLIDGEYFSWYGSRLLKAFEYFKSLYN